MIKSTIIALSLIFALSVGLYAQQANSCTSPNAQNFIPLIGHVMTKWNCWLVDEVYAYYRGRGFSDYLSANYASQAVQRDATDRLNAALEEIRAVNPQYFDQVMAVHGLQLAGPDGTVRQSW